MSFKIKLKIVMAQNVSLFPPMTALAFHLTALANKHLAPRRVDASEKLQAYDLS